MSTRREVYTCVEEHNLPALRAAIAAGHSVNECASFRHTPLMVAAARNYEPFVRVLLDAGADIEARSSFGSSALDEACDRRAMDTALLLIARGARGDAQGASGRTALQVAVKRGCVAIVRALLASGQADPKVRSHVDKNALYYVQDRDPCADELRRLLREYMSLDNAIDGRNVAAIEVLMRRVIDRDDDRSLSDAVIAFLKARGVAPLEHFRVELLLGSIAANDTRLFERVLVPDTPRPTPEARAHALETLRFASHSGTSALHIAAFYGHTQFVEYLLVDCGMDPCVEDAKGRRAVQLVDDGKDPTGDVSAVLVQTTRRRHVEVFTGRLLSYSGELPQLEALAQSLSSVYDLRAVFSLSAAALATRPAEMARVLTRAFTRLVDEKLVFDDRDALFSKMALRECRRRGFLSEAECEYWNMQIVKVNMESAPWVAALQRSVRRLDARVADVERRTSVLQREYQQLREAVTSGGGDDGSSSSVGQSLAMVASLLGDDGECFGAVLDLSSPRDVLSALLSASGLEGDVSSLVGDAAASLGELVVPTELLETFEAAGVDPVEFAGLLKDAIVAETQQEEEDSTKEADEVITDALTDLALNDAVEMNHDNDETEEEEEEDEGDEDNDVGEDPLVEFPFHFAVKHSHGDLAVFQDVIAYIDASDGDVNALATVTIPSSPSSKSHPVTVEQVSPAVFASHLGFVEIVKFLLLRQDVVATEKRFVTVQRAQQRAAAAACGA